MSDPQIWTVMGVFSAMMLGGFSLLARYLTSEIRALDVKHDARSDRLEAQIAGLGARLDTKIDTTAEGLEQRFDARADALGQRLDAKIDALGQRLDAKIDGVEQRLDAKIDHVADVLTLRIDAVDHRLGAVEDDLKIVKGHLLRHAPA